MPFIVDCVNKWTSDCITTQPGGNYIVTRFGKIPPLWQNLKVLGNFWGIISYLAYFLTYFGKFVNAVRHMII